MADKSLLLICVLLPSYFVFFCKLPQTSALKDGQCIREKRQETSWTDPMETGFFGAASCETNLDGVLDKQATNNIPSQPQIISFYPNIYLYRNCITNKQQENLLGLATERLTKETESGFSSSLYLKNKEDSKITILRDIAQLAGKLSNTQWRFAEPVALTKYKVGQKYSLHYDSGFLMNQRRVKRTATFLVYLNDVKSGGETIFPLATNISSIQLKKENVDKPSLDSICGKENNMVKVSPEVLSCLLFWNHVDGDDVDALSLHGSCPVVSGEKWIAQIWLHNEPWENGDFWHD
ncbi:prolyl 4-hydroxylase 5 [Nematostella vectensis]|uniref:prolyl 4-hydroxylase 5 n=1 Tax=Nematostella vectensis TaxID=45351 RepID=UPI002077605F|nr:prolyl 4-hydroxylase 5 [Nematostella vectensis]